MQGHYYEELKNLSLCKSSIMKGFFHVEKCVIIE